VTGGVLRTERLVIRPIEARDAEALAAYRGLPEVCRYVPFEPQDVAAVERRIREQWNRDTPDGGNRQFVAELDGRVIGDIVLFWHGESRDVAEIGWMMNPDAGGRGFATEAARAVLAFGFRELGIRRVTALLDELNVASARVAEKLGMRLEARHVEATIFKGELSTELIYALLAREFEA
jgi:RimJ/RimL family protein N-acetyltransferase